MAVEAGARKVKGDTYKYESPEVPQELFAEHKLSE